MDTKAEDYARAVISALLLPIGYAFHLTAGFKDYKMINNAGQIWTKSPHGFPAFYVEYAGLSGDADYPYLLRIPIGHRISIVAVTREALPNGRQ